MSAKIPLRTDYDAVQARALARKATDPNQVRRLLAIAAVYDGMNRRDAAAVGGMDRQSLRDWVYRFNQAGPEGLHDHKSPGAVPQLTAVERVSAICPPQKPLPKTGREDGKLSITELSGFGLGGRMKHARPVRGLVQTAVLCSALLVLLPTTVNAQQPVEGTLGFVVRDWFTAIYNSRFVDECPEGLSVSNDEIWWRGLSKEKRAELTENGLRSNLNRMPTAMRRGPEGENVCLNPTVVTDPPMRVVEGKYSYGVNLDGNSDGSATPKTCAHENFTHPDGTPGIDNQLYRVVGCVYGWRKGGLPELNAHEGRGTSGLGMVLIEVADVDDGRNDDDVTVTFYRSVDQFALDGSGRPLLFSSYNIDMDGDKPRYGDSLKGAIKDGVLTTERGDVSLPFYGNYNFMHPVIKDMDLRLEITSDGATANGLVSGYYNMDEFLYYVGGMVGHTSTADDCPAMYRAAHELADGYPDPETGQCTHLSTAFEVGAYAAFIIHPKDSTQQAAR